MTTDSALDVSAEQWEVTNPWYIWEGFRDHALDLGKRCERIAVAVSMLDARSESERYLRLANALLKVARRHSRRIENWMAELEVAATRWDFWKRLGSEYERIRSALSKLLGSDDAENVDEVIALSEQIEFDLLEADARIAPYVQAIDRQFRPSPSSKPNASEPANAEVATKLHRSKQRLSRLERHQKLAQITGLLNDKATVSAAEVSASVGMSDGFVKESMPWKANRDRLDEATRVGIDPDSLPLERFISERRVGSRPDDSATGHDQRSVYKRIDDARQKYPDASPEEVAKKAGTTAGEVEVREATLKRLTKEQSEDETSERRVRSGHRR